MFLPDHVWQMLADLMANCRDWPQVLLCCKTFMLPKCNEPAGPEQTRPITVAAIVYRLWASLHAKCVLSRWACQMPDTISGGLPGKGTADLLLHVYQELEHAYANRQAISGCVLDLIKAFNCISRPLALFALQRLGVPVWLVQKWSRALSQLQRFVTIAGSVSDGCESCTGLPEGDCFSILGMLSLAYAWSNLIAHDQLKSFCYADNFEWLTADFQLHEITLLKTNQFLLSMRMFLSQEKTFCWATGRQDEQKWATLWRKVFPKHQVRLMNDATDLGCEVHYGPKCRHTVFPQRFDAAIQKCSKLQALPLDLSVKLSMIQRSILPTALYGSEFAIPSDKLFQRLRTSIARSIVGNFKTASPWLTCNIMVVDPEYHFIKNCLRKCIKYLQKNPDKLHSFWALVNHADDTSTFFHGPAGVLGFVCRRLGWILQPSGAILAAPGLTLQLATVDVKQVYEQMDYSWVRIVNAAVAHRVFLHDLPLWSMQFTRDLILKCPAMQQKLVVYHLVGAIQSNIHRSKYQDSHRDQACTFCGERDTWEHQLFSCSVTASLRDSYPEWDSFRDLPSSLLHCPVFPLHEQLDFHRACCALRDSPLQTDVSDLPLLVYTDGSMVPSTNTVGLAAFAVVSIPRPEEEQLLHWVTAYETTQTMPPFQLPLAGKVKNRQTNNRAELTAIIGGLQLSRDIVLVTDSSYAKRVTDAVLRDPQLDHFVGWDNIDLIAELTRVVRNMQHVRCIIVKIRSHQSYPLAGTLWDRLHFLGNQIADISANQARNIDTVGFLQLHTDIVQHDVFWQKKLSSFYGFVIGLAQAYHEAWKQHKSVIQHASTDDVDDRLAILMAIPSAPLMSFEVSIAQELRSSCYFTSQFSMALAAWSSMLRWPQAFAVTATGVTFLELYLSFKAVTGLEAPVNISKPSLTIPTYVMRSVADIHTWQARAPHQELRAFEFALDYLVKLVGMEIFPIRQKGVTSCLSYLGTSKARTGYLVRPQYPYQKEILHHLHRSITANQGYWGLDHVPGLEVEPLVTIESQQDDWNRIATTSYRRFKELVRSRS